MLEWTRSPWMLAVFALAACAGESGRLAQARTTPDNRGDGGATSDYDKDPSHTVDVRAVVWVDDETICGQQCEWLEGTPWTETSRSLAAAVQAALYRDFARTVTTASPTDDQCAPNLAVQLQKTPTLQVYVKGDVPAELFSDRRLNFHRVSAEEFDREMDAPNSEATLLDISIVEPTQLGGTTDVGIAYYCETRTQFDGRQGRGGVAVLRAAHAIHVTIDSAYDE